MPAWLPLASSEEQGLSGGSQGNPLGAQSQIPSQGKTPLLGCNFSQRCMGLLEQLPSLRGFWFFHRQNSPGLRVPHLPLAPPWAEQSGSKEIPSLQACGVGNWICSHFPLPTHNNPCLCWSISERDAPMWKSGMVRFWCGFELCSHCGCCLARTAGRTWPGILFPALLGIQTAHQLHQQLMETPVY